MKTLSAGRTDVGRKRDNNEDSFFLDDQVGLYIVADGMGGHRAGEVASSTVVSSVKDYMEAFHTSPVAHETNEGNMSPAATAVCHSVELANRVVHQLSQDQGAYKGMGSTAAVAYFHNGTLITANVGDSRIYLVREDSMEQLTEDHTLLAEHMKKNPEWDPNTASIPMKHILVRAVGIHESVEADVYEMQPLSGDLILMCSDGLTDMLDDEEIHEAVLQGGDLEEICDRLVDMANERGGLDNVTTVLFLLQKEDKGLLQKLFGS
ncbi:MAG: Stp1/IreP family PP2C-type Ser/Thr phosphatase [Deltaproteobacteria bacterium]|nr:Stp1/IreP family PP2C-type Ser/Thr phosphatase [Deltaproteobacteria bacterium]